jgi:hypothetical protein
MAYIGVQPRLGNFQACDAITTSATTTFNLLVGGTAIFPQSAQHCLVSLNGVLQAPISSYTISGSTIIFAAALTTDDSIDFITILGDTLDLGVPSDDTVGAAQIKADLISGTTALAAEPADTDEFLVSDAGVLKRIDYSLIKGGGITIAHQWRLTTSFTGEAVPIASNWEQVDTDGYGGIGSVMSESSGIFTFPETGVYYISFGVNSTLSGEDRAVGSVIQTTTDNSSYSTASQGTTFITQTSGSVTYANAFMDFMFDVTNVSTHKCRFGVSNVNSSTQTDGSTAQNATYATFIRLGDT